MTVQLELERIEMLELEREQRIGLLGLRGMYE